jgi:hypothetical protein
LKKDKKKGDWGLREDLEGKGGNGKRGRVSERVGVRRILVWNTDVKK